MTILRLPLKLLVLPFVLVTSLVQWLGVLLVSISSSFLSWLLGIVSIIVTLSWAFGLTSEGNMICGLTLCAILFILPHIAKWCIIRIALVNTILKEFVRS